MRLNTLNVLLQAGVRRETFNGREHVVAPVVALVEGVHNGLLYSAAEIAKFPAAWNGIPIPALHPTGPDGDAISANSPDVIEASSIGTFFNAEINGEGKLVGELWIDVAKANIISPTVIGLLENHGKLEVSTALFTEDLDSTGSHNGEVYDAVATNFRPDHLAVLPGAVGACSWADGCGAPRTNAAGDVNHGDQTKCDGKGGCGGDCNCGPKIKTKAKDRKPLFETLAETFDRIKRKPSINQISHGTIRDALRSAINAESTNRDVYHYIEEVYDNFFIYEGEEVGQLFKRNYNVDADDNIILSDDKTEVELQVEFVPVVTNNINKGDSNMSDEAKVTLVKAIVANAAIECFGEDSEETLNTMSECQLQHILDAAKIKTETKTKANDDAAAAAGDDTGNKGADDNKGESDADTGKASDAKALTAADVATLVSKALAAQDTQPIIDRLIANDACPVTKEALDIMAFTDLIALERLVNPSAPPVVNYAGRGGAGVIQNDDSDKVPEMPKVFTAGSWDKK